MIAAPNALPLSPDELFLAPPAPGDALALTGCTHSVSVLSSTNRVRASGFFFRSDVRIAGIVPPGTNPGPYRFQRQSPRSTFLHSHDRQLITSKLSRARSYAFCPVGAVLCWSKRSPSVSRWPCGCDMEWHWLGNRVVKVLTVVLTIAGSAPQGSAQPHDEGSAMRHGAPAPHSSQHEWRTDAELETWLVSRCASRLQSFSLIPFRENDASCIV